MPAQFEWDEEKAAANWFKHRVRFETAKAVFQDPYAISNIDETEDYGEERFVTVGIAGGRLLSVVYTERQARFRLISARQATRHEQDDYLRQAK